MKKLLTILLVVTLLLAGCATSPSAPRTVPSTPPSAPSTVPDTSPSADDNRGEVAVASASGRVVDFSTRQPVEKAMVNIGNKSYFTDSLGNYKILEIPGGTLTSYSRCAITEIEPPA